MNKVWHIIKVAPSKTLKIHAMLLEYGFEVWTPYVIRHQKLTRLDKREGNKRRSYCHPVFGELGFMFVGLPESDYWRAALTLRTLMDKSRHIHDAVLSPVQGVDGPQWYRLPESSMSALISQYRRGYDPNKDNRKGSGRGFKEDVPIPVFTDAQIVQYREGPFRGIDFEVMGSLADKLFLEPVQKGFIKKVEASAFDVEGRAASWR